MKANVTRPTDLIDRRRRPQGSPISIGGVAHKPWRDPEAVSGQALTSESFNQADEAVVQDAKGYRHNPFKIELAKRAVVRALEQAAAKGGKQ